MALLKKAVACGGLLPVGRRLCAAFCVFAASLSLAGADAPAQAPISKENVLKAVFLFDFAQFLKWPAHAFPEAQSPIVIGVLGEDPFGAYLDGLVQGEKIGERPMLVRRFHRAEDVSECHILFISRSEASRLGKDLALMKGRSILTVGDMDGFNHQDGMVQFATEDGKIQLRINVGAAKAAELTISSKLLSHAVIVTSDKE